MTSVGFIGLGCMGLPMSLRLAETGCEVVGFDRDPLVCEADSPSHRRTWSVLDLATADCVLTMLPDGSAVREAILESGLAARLPPGATVIDSSSSYPAQSVSTGRALSDLGVRFIDAPVSGSPEGARLGTLTVMAGGVTDSDLVARDVLDRLGTVYDTGPLGTGHALKALNNLLASLNLAAATEVMLVGRQAGIEPSTMLAVLNASTGRNHATETKIGQFVLTRTFRSGFRLALMHKDIRNAARLADSCAGPTDFGRLCLELWGRAAADIDADVDNLEVVRWLERAAGTTLDSGDSDATGAVIGRPTTTRS